MDNSRRWSRRRNDYIILLGELLMPQEYEPPSCANLVEYDNQTRKGSRQYRFWYHYNKPASRKAGHPLFTVHYRNKCWITKSIVCSVATETHTRIRQPYAVVRGHCYNMSIDAEGWGSAISPFEWIWLHNDNSRWTNMIPSGWKR